MRRLKRPSCSPRGRRERRRRLLLLLLLRILVPRIRMSPKHYPGIIPPSKTPRTVRRGRIPGHFRWIHHPPCPHQQQQQHPWEEDTTLVEEPRRRRPTRRSAPGYQRNHQSRPRRRRDGCRGKVPRWPTRTRESRKRNDKREPPSAITRNRPNPR